MSFSEEIERACDQEMTGIDSQRHDDVMSISSEYMSCNEEFDIVEASEMQNRENVQEGMKSAEESRMEQATPDDLLECTCYFQNYDIDKLTGVDVEMKKKKFTFKEKVVSEASQIIPEFEQLDLGASEPTSKTRKFKHLDIETPVAEKTSHSPRRSCRTPRPSSRYSKDFVLLTSNRMKRKSLDISDKTPQQQQSNIITPNRKRKSDTFIEKPGRGPKTPKLSPKKGATSRRKSATQSSNYQI